MSLFRGWKSFFVRCLLWKHVRNLFSPNRNVKAMRERRKGWLKAPETICVWATENWNCRISIISIFRLSAFCDEAHLSPSPSIMMTILFALVIPPPPSLSMSRITSLFIPFRFIRRAKSRSQIGFVTGEISSQPLSAKLFLLPTEIRLTDAFGVADNGEAVRKGRLEILWMRAQFTVCLLITIPCLFGFPRKGRIREMEYVTSHINEMKICDGMQIRGFGIAFHSSSQAAWIILNLDCDLPPPSLM